MRDRPELSATHPLDHGLTGPRRCQAAHRVKCVDDRTLPLYWMPIADWLSNPLIPRVDILRVYPEYHWENEVERRVTRDDLVTLPEWPRLECLTELEPHGYLGDGTDELLPELRKRVRVNLSH